MCDNAAIWACLLCSKAICSERHNNQPTLQQRPSHCNVVLCVMCALCSSIYAAPNNSLFERLRPFVFMTDK